MPAEPAMSAAPLTVLYEDNHLLAVLKPAGLPTMGTPDGRPTLWTIAKQYIKERYRKPGNVYLGVVSRLDSPVTGVVLFARTSKAAARLAEQFRSRAVEKAYWAIVEGTVEPPAGEYVDWLWHDERSKRMRVVEQGTPGARQARLSYRRTGVLSGSALLEVELETGRKHQIRVQLAYRGHPIVGDVKYGSRRAFVAGIALHARRLAFDHPVRDERIELQAALPRSWRAAGVVEEE
jgi:23S rRNA pseudouridine1911/1915/1917 synthase